MASCNTANPCENDGDVCYKGVCTSPACSQDSDCAKFGGPLTAPLTGAQLNWFCKGGNCQIMPCETNSDCAAINPALTCQSGQCAAQLCSKNSDCNQASCVNGYCLFNMPPQTLAGVNYNALMIAFFTIIMAIVTVVLILLAREKIIGPKFLKK